MSIEVTLLKDGRELGCITVTGHLELGRRDQTDSRLSRTVPFDADIPGGKRWVIADAGSNRIPRKVCSIDVIGEGRVKVTNIHNSNKHLWVDESGTKTPILPEESIERMLPISLILPDELCVKVAAKAIEVVAPTPIPEPSSSRWESGGLGQVSSKRSSSGLESSGSWSSSNSSNSGSWNSGSTPLGFAGTVFAVESDQGVNDAVKSVLDAMKRVITALQEPIDNFAKYYEGLSKVIIDELKMDRVAIIRYMTNLATGEQSWDIQGRSEVVRDRKSGEQPPLTMSLLNRVLKTKSLAVYPNDDDLGPSESQSFLNYAIAAPLKAQTAEGEKVTGVLYADRNKSTLSADQSDFFSQNEKDLLDILVSAIALRESTAEKERGVATYRQFFPKKVIDKLVDKGQDFLEGRDTEVSVLFCDIRNFSKITHDLPAKDSMLWLNDTLEELSKCVLANDGVLVDYVGDELFAMWGAPEEDATHPLKCIKTAISMMELKKKLREKHGGIGAKIDFGIGLNSGKARVGNTGSKLKFKYGPMGTTVNLGSRIQGLTKQWGVSTLMTKQLADEVPSEYRKRRLCKAQVVGLDFDLDLYQLMSSEEADDELVRRYEEGLELFERQEAQDPQKKFREAARLFGELVQKHRNDKPSLMMLDRCVNQLVHPSVAFSPVWIAQSK